MDDDNPRYIPPTATDKEIIINNITANSISLSWTAASDNDTPADKLKYFFTYRKAGDATSSYKQVTGVTYTELTGLESETAYEITMSVYDKDENWDTYNGLVVSTTTVDAIKSVLITTPNAKMYNTSGVLVGKNYRGVVIINGKKYMKK